MLAEISDLSTIQHVLDSRIFDWRNIDAPVYIQTPLYCWLSHTTQAFIYRRDNLIDLAFFNDQRWR